MNIIASLILLVFFITGAAFLQIFLSRRRNKWFGIILPFISFIFSIIAVLGIAMYSITPSFIGMAIMVFLLYNIPTAILLAIYFACREKIKRNSSMDKMRIQDLE